jgi:hypothetical protein
VAVTSTWKPVVGVFAVLAISVLVWSVRVPSLPVVFFSPILLGVGVGVVSRYSTVRPGALVVTAVVTAATRFGLGVVQKSSYGLARTGLHAALVVALLVVLEVLLATVVGARVGVSRRARDQLGSDRGTLMHAGVSWSGSPGNGDLSPRGRVAGAPERGAVRGASKERSRFRASPR